MTDPTTPDPDPDLTTDVTPDVTTDAAAVPGSVERAGLPTRKVISEQRMRSLSRRSVLVGGVAAIAGATAFRKITSGEQVGRTPKALRASYEFNEDLWSALTDIDRLAPEFEFARSAMPIVNGRRNGVSEDIEEADWSLSVVDPNGTELANLTLDDIKAMPFTETIFEFKCIEGWSEITAFGGVRVSDFLAAVAPGMEVHPWVGMNTPDGGYPVSLDMQTLMHPQTVLAYEMQRAPLTQGHGFPLRLATPLKYGIKNIRRPATFVFADEPQPDYWGERGYSDWAGL